MIATKKFSFSVIKEKPIFSFFILYFGIVLVWWEKLCPEKKKGSYFLNHDMLIQTLKLFQPLYLLSFVFLHCTNQLG